jgi:hypothetical protein
MDEVLELTLALDAGHDVVEEIVARWLNGRCCRGLALGPRDDNEVTRGQRGILPGGL